MLVILFLSLSTPLYAAASTGNDVYSQTRCLKVPVNEFVESLKSTLDIIKDVTSTISNFGGFLGDLRLSNAITDCLDLLDFSADELEWTMFASQSPEGSKHNSTGDTSYDIRTWLSAALANQDTCIQGLDGTRSTLNSIVGVTLNQITSLVQQILTQVEPSSDAKSHGGEAIGGVGLSGTPNDNTNNQFPFWFNREDRKLLLINGVTPDVVVAADGTGNFTKIMDAVNATPEYSLRRYVIYVKRGVYNEYVEINKKKWNIVMVGEGMNVTIITGNRSTANGLSTFRTATFAVNGKGFIARDIRFENTAGPAKNQSVALRSNSDLSVYYRCEFGGYQDTLYTHSNRQFYRECRISGTVDFIFGFASAVFQNCDIRARKGLDTRKMNTITAHGREHPNEPTGYTFQFCNISADTDLLPYVNSTYTDLGRSWRDFSRTIIMQSYISDAIRPEGWLEWHRLDTLYYAEYSNYGPGAELKNRVKWPGYHVLNTSDEANNFTVDQFIKGDLWLRSIGVSYTPGLEV